MREHVLKTHDGPFDASWRGLKPYEIRVNDRGYQVGDRLLLREYLANLEQFTGRWIRLEVTYMTRGGEWGLPENLCVLGTRLLVRGDG